MSFESTHDVRVVLVRDKYFSLRPKPLERWLWRQSIAPSAERVFWLHWEEGHRSGTWCSEIPLRRVAAECCLDVSTVTRAYQQLASLGLIRRQDPGRDPANPFQQATAITEVRVPRELLVEIDRHPNRSRRSPTAGISVQGIAATATSAKEERAETAANPADSERPADPFKGLSIRQRLNALSALTAQMSAAERSQFDEAQRTHASRIEFDANTALDGEERAKALQFLAVLAAAPAAQPSANSPSTSSSAVQAHTYSKPRKLSLFELARVRRDIAAITTPAETSDVLRQVVWSVEQGALRRFTPLHAVNIALKKLREGGWSRPNRMPPNWLIEASRSAAPETCRSA
jgi:hypothetical protein